MAIATVALQGWKSSGNRSRRLVVSQFSGFKVDSVKFKKELKRTDL
jgi:hypothetical protein